MSHLSGRAWPKEVEVVVDSEPEREEQRRQAKLRKKRKKKQESFKDVIEITDDDTNSSAGSKSKRSRASPKLNSHSDVGKSYSAVYQKYRSNDPNVESSPGTEQDSATSPPTTMSNVTDPASMMLIAPSFPPFVSCWYCRVPPRSSFKTKRNLTPPIVKEERKKMETVYN
ncbi:hypothetical protein CERSUDRAFT_91417 [Gelatoporia subvermispora B]|uniref:Uncharacterized protein n=1 Tax=Ceriporiopsis subvermispora (strain B) TaxID=914234 RepID=M2PV72_CERS8|nr:hypothetical protein CERSUDRAFT_91417 [Gelatoporia subvermispora B]